MKVCLYFKLYLFSLFQNFEQISEYIPEKINPTKSELKRNIIAVQIGFDLAFAEMKIDINAIKNNRGRNLLSFSIMNALTNRCWNQFDEIKF